MEGVQSANKTDEHAKKRTQRVQLACLPCRDAKLKCNKDYPVCDQVCFAIQIANDHEMILKGLTVLYTLKRVIVYLHRERSEVQCAS